MNHGRVSWHRRALRRCRDPDFSRVLMPLRSLRERVRRSHGCPSYTPVIRLTRAPNGRSIQPADSTTRNENGGHWVIPENTVAATYFTAVGDRPCSELGRGESGASQSRWIDQASGISWRSPRRVIAYVHGPSGYRRTISSMLTRLLSMSSSCSAMPRLPAAVSTNPRTAAAGRGFSAAVRRACARGASCSRRRTR